MFGFKKKPKVEFWSEAAGLLEVAPVTKTIANMPAYFKQMPKKWTPDHKDPGTAKSCPGIIDLFKNAYTIPLWTDIEIVIHDKNNADWHTSSESFTFSWHASGQFLDYLPNKDEFMFTLKADCPWFARTPKGYSLLQIPALYSMETRFEVMTGVIRSDWHHVLNQQIVFKGKMPEDGSPATIFLERGTPLVSYVPFKREEFDTDVRYGSTEDMTEVQHCLARVDSKFSGAYRKRMKDDEV